jgi:hypothetical protein
MNPHIAQEAVLEDAGTYSKGTPLITHNRITQRAVNRLWPASDEDIVVPGGVVSILGITSICGPHIMVYLFDRGELGADKCLDGLWRFARSRWKGLIRFYGINNSNMSSYWKRWSVECWDWN